METKEKLSVITRTLSKKSADDIEVIEISELTILADYFVIASASNTTHVRALADEVEFVGKEHGFAPSRIEGYQTSNWIVLDYGDIIVHLFYQQTREFYNLDKLWRDGVKIDLQTLLAGPDAAEKQTESERDGKKELE